VDGRPHRAGADAHRLRDLGVTQVEVEAQYQGFALPVGQALHGRHHFALLLSAEGSRLGRGRRRQVQHARPTRGSPPGRPAAVENARAQVPECLLGVGQVVPAPVQPAEGVLNNVLGEAPAAAGDVRKPGQAECVLAVERGYRGPSIQGLDRLVIL